MEEEQNLLSSNLERIKDAIDDMRTNLDIPDASIEDVATSVETLNTMFSDTIQGGTYNAPGFPKTVLKLPKYKYVNGDSLSYSFAQFKGTELDLRGLDTSNVTTLAYCFSGCDNLTSLNCAG